MIFLTPTRIGQNVCQGPQSVRICASCCGLVVSGGSSGGRSGRIASAVATGRCQRVGLTQEQLPVIHGDLATEK
jgi:hypothetical protein